MSSDAERREAIRAETTLRYHALDDLQTTDDLDAALRALGEWMESLPYPDHRYALQVYEALTNEESVLRSRADDLSLDAMQEDLEARARAFRADLEEDFCE